MCPERDVSGWVCPGRGNQQVGMSWERALTGRHVLGGGISRWACPGRGCQQVGVMALTFSDIQLVHGAEERHVREI